MKIIIETIPHSDQLYPTCGNWQFDLEGNLKVSVSDMNNWKYELLVGLHEVIEASLCKDRGIEQKAVDEFDMAFETLRVLHPEMIGDMEPGDMSSAPYNAEHQSATNIEKLLSSYLQVNWKDYDKEITNLAYFDTL